VQYCNDCHVDHDAVFLFYLGYLLRFTKDPLDKVIVNLTPVRVAHSRRKGAKKILDYRVNLGVFAALRETKF
jgi:hypothetical protein